MKIEKQDLSHDLGQVLAIFATTNQLSCNMASTDEYLELLDLAMEKLTTLGQSWQTDIQKLDEPGPEFLKQEQEIITLVRSIPKKAVTKSSVLRKKINLFSQQWLEYAKTHFSPSLKRINNLKEVYFETAHIPESEKKEEWKRYGEHVTSLLEKNHHPWRLIAILWVVALLLFLLTRFCF